MNVNIPRDIFAAYLNQTAHNTSHGVVVSQLEDGEPYLLARCGLVMSAQQVDVSPHSRPTIRAGESPRIPAFPPTPPSNGFWDSPGFGFDRLDWRVKLHYVSPSPKTVAGGQGVGERHDVL
ncbi:hypothetical protein NHX12_013261 [Muraenolepis orangiensis]|uniref:Uncharacterized protein n=1 Tax=Muraenolepis orangiensis TaxID=630683 RepID=A0A9Q0I5R5_9TELE|nr:hypothetical protein NHX12_013261 [Muraenolepis orangiensis]